MSCLARWLLGFPVRRTTRRVTMRNAPAARLRVEPFEDRVVPAVYAVTLLSPVVGEPGETAAAHAGELRVNPALTARDGEQVIGAATPADAIRSALTGTVSISVGGQSASYPFGRDTAGTSAADHQPYFVAVSGTEGRVWLEDMAGLPDPDWDYDDRSWRVSIRPLSSGSFSGGSVSGAGGGMTSPLSPTIDSGQFTWTNLFGETATAVYEVTEYAPDIWLWQYTVTNNDLSASSPPPRHGVADIDIPAAAGAGVFDVQITGDVSNWHAEPDYPYWYRDSVAGSYLAPGQTAVLTFKTPPVPILPVTGSAFVGARLPSHAEGPAKGPGGVVDLDIEGLDDATEHNFPGKKIRVNDNIDELQFKAGVPIAGDPKLMITPDNLPHPDTGLHQLLPADPDVVNGTLTVGPAGTVGDLSWAMGDVQVWWQVNGAWVPVSDKANYTATGEPIELKIEGMKPGQPLITVYFGKSTDPLFMQPKDIVATTVYTGLRVTGYLVGQFKGQVATTGGWTLDSNAAGDFWRTAWVAEKNISGHLGYSVAEPWQVRARTKLEPIFRSEKQTVLTADANIKYAFDDFATKMVDPPDLGICFGYEQKFGAAMTTHVLVEQYEKQVNGITVYLDAHSRACDAEAHVYVGEGTRTETKLMVVGTVETWEWKYSGITLNIDFDKAQQPNVVAIRRP